MDLEACLRTYIKTEKNLRKSGSLVRRKIYVFGCIDCGKEMYMESRGKVLRATGRCKRCAYKVAAQSRRKKPFEFLYNRFMRGAVERKLNLDCDITYEDFVALTDVKECFYCGENILWAATNTDKKSWRYNLDRKDNNLGYSKTNVVVSCWECNKLKSIFGYFEFLDRCAKIAQRHRPGTYQPVIGLNVSVEPVNEVFNEKVAVSPGVSRENCIRSYMRTENSLDRGKYINRRKIYVFKCVNCENEVHVRSCNIKAASGRCRRCATKVATRKMGLVRRKPPFMALYNQFIYAARIKGNACDITYEDFCVLSATKECFYCGEKITWAVADTNRNSHRYNLDRKDNHLGYLKTNVVVCCSKCNRMKNDNTYQDFIDRCSRIAQEHCLVRQDSADSGGGRHGCID